MPKSKRKRTRSAPVKKRTKLPLDPLRTGMPALDSITGVDELRTGKQVYRVIHTNAVDEYELKASKPKGNKQI